MTLPADGRQSETALSVRRGTCRLLRGFGFSPFPELTLPSGRRADITALGQDGAVWIVEIKSSLEDFRSDTKWPDYRAHCDRLFFAAPPEMMDHAIFPEESGLIIADSYGAELVREAPEHRLAGATRKAVTLRLARAAAERLLSLEDPHAGEVG